MRISNLLVKPANGELLCMMHDKRVKDYSMLSALDLQFGRRVGWDEKQSISITHSWVTNKRKNQHEVLGHVKKHSSRVPFPQTFKRRHQFSLCLS